MRRRRRCRRGEARGETKKFFKCGIFQNVIIYSMTYIIILFKELIRSSAYSLFSLLAHSFQYKLHYSIAQLFLLYNVLVIYRSAWGSISFGTYTAQPPTLINSIDYTQLGWYLVLLPATSPALISSSSSFSRSPNIIIHIIQRNKQRRRKNKDNLLGTLTTSSYVNKSNWSNTALCLAKYLSRHCFFFRLNIEQFTVIKLKKIKKNIFNLI